MGYEDLNWLELGQERVFLKLKYQLLMEGREPCNQSCFILFSQNTFIKLLRSFQNKCYKNYHKTTAFAQQINYFAFHPVKFRRHQISFTQQAGFPQLSVCHWDNQLRNKQFVNASQRNVGTFYLLHVLFVHVTSHLWVNFYRIWFRGSTQTC